MAIKEIKDYSAVTSPASADKLITQQDADNVTRYITPTQIIATQKGLASGIASLSAGSKVNEQPASISDFLDDTAGGTDAQTAKAPTSNVMYDHGVATTGVHGVGAGTICSEETADTKDTAAVAAHVAEGDPHTQYRLESADHNHLSSGAQGGVLNLFGTWDDSKTYNTVYQAATDGFVAVAAATTTADWKLVCGYTDGSNPPTTIRNKGQTNGGSLLPMGFLMPVRKGDYWKVASSDGTINSATIYWLPIGG